MLLSTLPYICIWLVLRDLLQVAPNWPAAQTIIQYGWWAFGFAVAGMLLYFAALMCTHFAAFRTASNIRKQGMDHLLHAPLGFFEGRASGYLRNRLDAGAADTETLLAHILADVVGTVVLFFTMIGFLLYFDWRMGAACLLSVLISVLALFSMMGGKHKQTIAEYQRALDDMSKAATEYVRGIPVVKIFQQTIYTFRTFKKAIEEYSVKADEYQGVVCRFPQSVNLTFTKSAFVFLIPFAFLLAPEALASGNFGGFLTNFAFYAVFSAIISTALAKLMFAAGGVMQAQIAMDRLDEVLQAPTLKMVKTPKQAQGHDIVFREVCFTYEGAASAALTQVSFTAKAGEVIALVGPSGGGKTTIASLIPRFWDASSGAVEIGGVDVREWALSDLMRQVAFVFQNNHLFKASIYENVLAGKPDATPEEIAAALHAAQCDDILEKFPEGMDTVIGTQGTYLSGGEQQRIAIARAILKDAPIVILDEATAFADPENERLIQAAFSELMRGKTVLMIAHRLSTVVGADQILVVKDGSIAERGTHKELLEANGLYARMWTDYRQSLSWRIQTKTEVR